MVIPILPFIPLICSVIVIWYCWKSSKFLKRNPSVKRSQQIGLKRFSFKIGTDQIGLGVFLLIMAVVSFIIRAILYNNGYIIFEVGYLISLIEGLVFLIAGTILIINGVLIEKRN